MGLLNWVDEQPEFNIMISISLKLLTLATILKMRGQLNFAVPTN
jgi:hypothetical protein